MAQASGMKQVGYINCAGGGQIIVQNGFAYIGHMRAPFGTTIVDVRDPQNPEMLSELRMEPGTHSHKVRVFGDIMIINQESNHNDDRTREAARRDAMAGLLADPERMGALVDVWQKGLKSGEIRRIEAVCCCC